MTYAYVTDECCKQVSAVKPGQTIGRNEIAVSRHGDYHAWTLGKRRTRQIMLDSRDTAYMRRCAKAVALTLGWIDKSSGQ